eukprot:tig00000073_g1739.t1
MCATELTPPFCMQPGFFQEVFLAETDLKDLYAVSDACQYGRLLADGAFDAYIGDAAKHCAAHKHVCGDVGCMSVVVEQDRIVATLAFPGSTGSVQIAVPAIRPAAGEDFIEPARYAKVFAEAVWPVVAEALGHGLERNPAVARSGKGLDVPNVDVALLQFARAVAGAKRETGLLYLDGTPPSADSPWDIWAAEIRTIPRYTPLSPPPVVHSATIDAPRGSLSAKHFRLALFFSVLSSVLNDNVNVVESPGKVMEAARDRVPRYASGTSGRRNLGSEATNGVNPGTLNRVAKAAGATAVEIFRAETNAKVGDNLYDRIFAAVERTGHCARRLAEQPGRRQGVVLAIETALSHHGGPRLFILRCDPSVAAHGVLDFFWTAVSIERDEELLVVKNFKDINGVVSFVMEKHSPKQKTRLGAWILTCGDHGTATEPREFMAALGDGIGYVHGGGGEDGKDDGAPPDPGRALPSVDKNKSYRLWLACVASIQARHRHMSDPMRMALFIDKADRAIKGQIAKYVDKRFLGSRDVVDYRMPPHPDDKGRQPVDVLLPKMFELALARYRGKPLSHMAWSIYEAFNVYNGVSPVVLDCDAEFREMAKGETFKKTAKTALGAVLREAKKLSLIDTNIDFEKERETRDKCNLRGKEKKRKRAAEEAQRTLRARAPSPTDSSVAGTDDTGSEWSDE